MTKAVGNTVTFDVLVEVRPRAGVADPQGATIERAIPMLGVHGIHDVRVGKAIRFTLDAPDSATARRMVTDLCERFLTNPVIEDAVITVSDR
jgi:phosphoribosylformylglycinamidine synthase subunit PurS